MFEVEYTQVIENPQTFITIAHFENGGSVTFIANVDSNVSIHYIEQEIIDPADQGLIAEGDAIIHRHETCFY